MFNENENIKAAALAYAIRAGCGGIYNEEGKYSVDPDILLKAAEKFENYLKGTDND